MTAMIVMQCGLMRGACSEDTQTVYHGRREPVYACGKHVQVISDVHTAPSLRERFWAGEFSSHETRFDMPV